MATRLPWRTLPAALCASLVVGGCVQAPATPQHLDEQTGVTIRQMGRPLEFQSPDPAGPDALWFAYLGALEVNRMGVLNRYLWLSVMPAGPRRSSAARGKWASTSSPPAAQSP